MSLAAIQKKSEPKASAVHAKAGPASVATDLATPMDISLFQRKSSCACGGFCPSCRVKDEFIQPKLKIAAPNDKYEQEADRVADQVMRMPESKVQRQKMPDEETEEVEEPIHANPLASAITPLVQRLVADEEQDDDLVQTKSTRHIAPVMTPSISSDIQSLQGGGQPLSRSTRGFFEHRIGADFSSVRIHNDTRATRAAQSVNARAFTLGHDVVFGAGEYSPQTSSGRKLLAHELTHVVQQNGNTETVHRDNGNTEATEQIELCFVPIGQYGLGQVGGVHAVLNIHHSGRVTRVEVDPNHHGGVEDPAAASMGPGRAAGLHSHVVISSRVRSTGTCHTYTITTTEAAAAVSAAQRYESMDVVYEPPGLGPNSNSFGEWVLHEAGVDTSTISPPAGALGWDWYIDNPGTRGSPLRVARTFQGTAAGCSQAHAPVRGFQQLIDLIRQIETQLIACGMSDVGKRLNLMRGVFYGTPWSRDFNTSQQSHSRNQMFNLYSGTTQPRNPIECVDCGLFLSLGESQDVSDGSRKVDVGHMLIGMDARRSYMARNLTQPLGQVTGLEATTWAGDLGGGAARLAMARRNGSPVLATRFFRETDYGGSINLEGDVAGYAAGAASTTTGSVPSLAIPTGSGVADTLELYLIGIPATPTTPVVPRGWDSRCTTFITAVGGTFNNVGALTNRPQVLAYLAEQIHDFGCWYMVTYKSSNPLILQQMEEASRHMVGAANEVAEVFLSALENCHNNPGSPLTAGSAPPVTPIGSQSCGIALAAPRSQQALEEAGQEGERLLDEAQRRGERLIDDADNWIERRQREAQRWWRDF